MAILIDTMCHDSHVGSQAPCPPVWHLIIWNWNCDLMCRCGQGVERDRETTREKEEKEEEGERKVEGRLEKLQSLWPVQSPW